MARRKQVVNKLNILALVNISVFTSLLLFIGVLSFIVPKPTISEYEKRELAKMPKFSFSSLIKGKYTSDIELFFADTFPFRENLISLSSSLEQIRGLEFDNVRIHTNDTPPVPKPEVKEEKTKEKEKPITTDQPSTDVGEQIGSIFVYKNKALPIFGSNIYASQRYANVLNSYHDILLDDVTIYNLVIPSSIEFGLPEKYKDITSNQKENIDYIYSLLNKDIKTVDAYSMIAKHKGEYLYFATDHHWTVNSAYYAYEAFCNTAGLVPVPLEKMEKRTLSNFIGTLYGQTNDSSLLENPDHVDYYIPPQPYTSYRYIRNAPYYPYKINSIFADYATGVNSYSVFLHGDFPLTVIKTGLKTGRKIAVVKESFGNAFAPFLISHYDEVYIVDQRYFQLGFINFIKQNGINELLFINNIFAANTDIRINEINRLKYQQFVPPVVKEKEEEEIVEPTTQDNTQDIVTEGEEQPVSSQPQTQENVDNEVSLQNN